MSNAALAALLTGIALFIVASAVIGYYYWTFVFAPGMERAWRAMTPEDPDGK